MEMKLSNNFKLSEFTKSITANRLHINNQPTEIELNNIQELVNNCLQPISDHYKRAVMISSGFRSKELNKAVGGVNKGKNISQHVEGKAADFTVDGVLNIDVIKWISNNLEFDQLIEEFGKWIHLSYNKDKNRKMILKAFKSNGKTIYNELEV